MEIVDVRTVIKHLYLKGLTGKAVYEDLEATLGENAPSFTNGQEMDRGIQARQNEHRGYRLIWASK